MAQNRLAKILKGMAGKKELTISHYRIYLCLFAGVQEGTYSTQKSLTEETGMSLRSVQRTIKELIEAGTVSKDKQGMISVTFDSGIGRDTRVVSNTRSGDEPLYPPQSLSIPDLRSYILYYISPNQISNIRTVKRNKRDITLKILDLPKVDLMSPDFRFQKVVDGIFTIYEKETGRTLNLLFKAADGAMIKRMLTKLPEESISRLLISFKNFVTTTDGFDADHVHQAPVRYWATRATKWLPRKELDFSKVRDNITREN